MPRVVAPLLSVHWLLHRDNTNIPIWEIMYFAKFVLSSHTEQKRKICRVSLYITKKWGRRLLMAYKPHSHFYISSSIIDEPTLKGAPRGKNNFTGLHGTFCMSNTFWKELLVWLDGCFMNKYCYIANPCVTLDGTLWCILGHLILSSMAL